MKKLFIVIVLFSVVYGANAQTTETKYLNAKYEEVPKEKAKYAVSTIQNTDGSTTKEKKDVGSGEIINSVTYKKDEPWGIHKIKYVKEIKSLDYNFSLIYTDIPCPKNSLMEKITNYFSDDSTQNYIAPKLAGEGTLFQQISKNMVYPVRCQENNISGKIIVQFTIGNAGNVENVSVLKGANILLDKEAVRVIRELKFLNPPTINGKPVETCFVIPLVFKLS